MDDRLDILQRTGLLNDLTPDYGFKLAELATEQRFTAGSIVLREDSRSRDLYVIKKGRVSIRLGVPAAKDKEEVIFMLRDGQIFGEMSLVDGSPRSATVKAEDAVTVYTFEYDKLVKFLETEPKVGYYFMRNIAAIIAFRTRNTNMLWRNLMIW